MSIIYYTREGLPTLSLSNAALLIRGFFFELWFFADFDGRGSDFAICSLMSLKRRLRAAHGRIAKPPPLLCEIFCHIN